MKKITAIVRAEKLEVLKDALFAADVRGMTINQVQGCGAQHGWKEYVRGNELLVNTIPKVQFTLICADEHVDGIVDIICNAARTGAVGDGKIWVEPVEEVIRIPEPWALIHMQTDFLLLWQAPKGQGQGVLVYFS